MRRAQTKKSAVKKSAVKKPHSQALAHAWNPFEGVGNNGVRLAGGRKKAVEKESAPKAIRPQVSRAQAHERLHELSSQGYSLPSKQRVRFLASQGRNATFSYSSPCNHDLSEADIRSGFTDNNVDFTTVCPVCQKRIIASAFITLEGVPAARFPLLCPDQTRDQVNYFIETRNLSDRSDEDKVEQLSLRRPALAWNALWHGRGDPLKSVKEMIQEFLFGTLPESDDPFAAAQNFIPLPPVPPEEQEDEIILFGEGDNEEQHNDEEHNNEKHNNEEIRVPGPRPMVGKAAVRRTVRKNGVRRVAKTGASRVQSMADAYINDLVTSSTLATNHRRAKTLTSKDVDLVAAIWRNQGRSY